MKDIKIRNLDKKVIKNLSEASRKKGFKNRDDFILSKLNNKEIRFSYSEKLEDDYIMLIKRLSKLIEYNTIALNSFEKYGIDISEFY